MKKSQIAVSTMVTLMMLAGCSIGGTDRSKAIPEQIVDENKYESIREQGIFLGIFNTKFIDIEVNEQREMFSLPEEIKKAIAGLQKGSKIAFEYAKSKDGEFVIRSIRPLGGVVALNEPVVKLDPVLEPEPVEDVIKEEAEPEKEEEDGEYKVDGNVITKGNVKAVVETNVNEDIKKERWRAAAELKKHGTISETKRTDGGFTFSVKTATEYREVTVQNVNGKMVRVTKVIPSAEKEQVQKELDTIVEGVNR